MSIVTLDARAANVAHCLVTRENCEGYCLGEHTHKHGRMLSTAIKQFTEIVRKSVNHWVQGEVTVEVDKLGTEGRTETVMVMSRTANKLLKLLPLRKAFISLVARWF